jgi:UDP-N-acetylglucosamine diphosphorylase/glucosamine-1-phosphate N-acetyltransferase
MRLCHFEDRVVDQLEPLSLTRPAFDLLCGMTSLGDKQRECFSSDEVGVVVRPYLAEQQRLRHPDLPVNDLAWLRAAPTVLVNGRWLPPSQTFAFHDAPCVGLIDDQVAYVVLKSENLAECAANTLDECLGEWKRTLPCHAAPGQMIHYLWDLVAANAGQLILDCEQLPLPVQPSPEMLSVVGPVDRLFVDPSAVIEPLVLANTTQGPVVIAAGAVVTAFTRLEGPCFIGPGTHVLGAKIRAGTTLGPCCRVGGEIEASIFHGNSNKYHDGFLGHAYVGEWVNLGAGTSNSDLRNDYGEVTVTANGKRVPTGLAKVGCFLGDHTKSGIGTLLNTGTNAGVFTNLLPSGSLLPKYVPSFTSWWNGAVADNVDLAEALQTAAIVMQRRGQAFTEAHAALYRHLFELKEGERRQLQRAA